MFDQCLFRCFLKCGHKRRIVNRLTKFCYHLQPILQYLDPRGSLYFLRLLHILMSEVNYTVVGIGFPKIALYLQNKPSIYCILHTKLGENPHSVTLTSLHAIYPLKGQPCIFFKDLKTPNMLTGMRIESCIFNSKKDMELLTS